MPESIKIEGLKEAVGMLRELARDDENGPKTAKGIVRRGLRAGAKPLLAAAKSEAPVRSGLLQQSLKIRSSSRKGRLSVSVGTRAKDFTGPTYYAGFVIWGHYAGSRELGSKRKHVPGNDFITRAYESAKDEAADVATQTILDGIDKAALS